MRKRSEVARKPQPDAAPIGETVLVSTDPVNEQVILAAAVVDPEARARLVAALPAADAFLEDKHRAAWAALLECARRRLEPDLATLARLGADAAYLGRLVELRPEGPAARNLDYHVQALQWDRQRATAVQGPIAALLEAVRNPAAAPERVRALARSVGEAFDGGAGRGAYLHDPAELVREHVATMRKRMEGHACFPYGVDAIDRYESGAANDKGVDISGRARLLPGAAPGQVTVITGVSGCGKSTVASGHMALGLARQGRRVLVGSWEMGGGMTLELLSLLSLGWSRQSLIEGQFTGDDLVEFEQEMHRLSQQVVFMKNAFRRHVGTKASNDRNLDVVQQHIEDSGCEVFIADLWERCLESDDPSDEKRALFRQQAMAEQTQTHHVLLAQQRLKDIEQREDKRPTREGIKGSSAWVDVADTILGLNRPALWKRTDDNLLEGIVLKQRYGQWPQAFEVEWDPEFGSLGAGRTVAYERPGAGNELDQKMGMTQPKRGGKRKS